MAAFTGLKFVKESLTTLAQGKIEAESQTRILEALDRLGTAQDALFELREQLFALQSDNAALAKQIEEHCSWKAQIAQYELIQTPGSAVVYRFKGEPIHYACPSCVNKQKVEILQDNRTISGKFRCTGCGNEFPINPRHNPPPPRVNTGGWM
jgi:hypothetical protein